MARTVTRCSLLLASSVVVACSQPPSTSGGSGPAPSAITAAAGPTPVVVTAASAAHPACEDEDVAVPTEKFAEAARNFEEAKKALLEGYYDTTITEDDLYRAAVAGMLERVDPKMHKWNRLMAPSEIAQLRNDLQGEIVGVGVGIELDPATGYID